MNIMLVCNGAISTNMIVKAMNKAAAAAGESHEIWAVPFDMVKANADEKLIDVVLLGPQVSYLEKSITSQVKEGTKVSVIGFREYGSCDGAAVLKLAKKVKGV